MTSLDHPRHHLDGLLTHGVRLSIVAALSRVEKAEFGAVRDLVEINDVTLSKQTALLEAAGYLSVDKGKVGRRPRTWLSLTAAGQEVLTRHLEALRSIASSPAPRPPEP